METYRAMFEDQMCRKSAKLRIKTGVFLSSIRYLAFFSGNFALSTAAMHEFTRFETLSFMAKYSVSGFLLSVPYFTINELITASLFKRKIENYFVTHSATSIMIMPFFALAQKTFRGISWRESRFLAYRYVGTICCFSLMGELILGIYKYRKLGLFSEDKINSAFSLRVNDN
jgi:hypothetical protein